MLLFDRQRSAGDIIPVHWRAGCALTLDLSGQPFRQQLHFSFVSAGSPSVFIKFTVIFSLLCNQRGTKNKERRRKKETKTGKVSEKVDIRTG